MITDNLVIVNRMEELPALMCVQRKAAKKVPTEEDTIKSNIDSFGDDIGMTTNWITSMYDVQAKYPKGSREYNEITYRIMCGQLYQQNTIDKAKGIICKPMPREWHDRHAVFKIENPEKRSFYLDIVADKKPYFMRYIYPALMRDYRNYIKSSNKSARREFGLDVKEMQALPYAQLTEQQKEFLRYYDIKMPVGMNDCVMNRICRRFEREFDGYLGRHNATTTFDYTILKSDAEYTRKQYNAVSRLLDEYNQRMKSYAVFANYERVDEYDVIRTTIMIREEFERECTLVCPNRFALCNIVLDLCYRKGSTKRFAWEMCGNEIIENLLARNGGKITFPAQAEDGDIIYNGRKFKMQGVVMNYSNDSDERIGECGERDCSQKSGAESVGDIALGGKVLSGTGVQPEPGAGYAGQISGEVRPAGEPADLGGNDGLGGENGN